MSRRELQYEVDDEDRIPGALMWVESFLRRGLQGGPVLISLGRLCRTLDQNALLWTILTDISRQVEWYGQHLTKEEWKEVLSAALKQQKVVPGIEGGLVILGASTSRMRKDQFSQLIELIYCFGSEHEVNWSGISREVFAKHRAAA